MTSRVLALLLTASAVLAGCGKLPPATAGLGEVCQRSADCAAPYVCLDGRCIVDEGRACEPGALRCNGENVEQCGLDGDGFQFVEQCATGCTSGACNPAVCEPGERKCESGALFECLASGSGYGFVQSCLAGCGPSGDACAEPVCVPYEKRCDPGSTTVQQTCNAQGNGWVDAQCQDGEVCAGGECQLRACRVFGSGASAVRDERCHGDVREACADDLVSYSSIERCEFGCVELNGKTSCAPAACEPGETRCDGDTLMRCAPDQRGFAFVQFCAAGCASTGGVAQCRAPVCSALATRCGIDTVSGDPIVEQCRPSGTGWDAIESCQQTCAEGACVVSDARCSVGSRRCNGQETQVCVRVDNGATEWRFEERCIGACLGSACDTAGACGCTGGLAGDRCGSVARQPVRVELLLPAGTQLPADGQSTVLAYTTPIVSAQGELVPDGTLVTFAHDGAESLFVSADADPTRPGLQRPTLRGRARAVLRAPSSMRPVTVQATLGGSCTGSTTLATVAAGDGTRTGFFAEDFSTTARLDRLSTTAQWDVTRAMARATPLFDLGTGADSDFVVQAGETRNLWDEALAQAWRVTTLGQDEARIDSLTPSLHPGDEVLLIALSGDATVAGRYEFKRVVRVEAGRVEFDSPVTGRYGPAGNGDLDGQLIALQRVPQFSAVMVRAGASLTTRPFGLNGNELTGTGVLALRARGTVTVLGEVSMQNAGLPAGTVQTGTPTSSLDRLLLGAGTAGGAGGGVVFIAARTLTLKADGSATADGLIQADSSAARAGAVWLQAGTVTIGSDAANVRVRALGSTDGHVRLDYGAIEDGARTAPVAWVGQRGAFVAQSLPAIIETTDSGGTQRLVHSVELVGVLGGAGLTLAGLPAQVPGVTIRVYDQGPSEWVNANAGPVSIDPAQTVRYQALLETLSDVPMELLGVALRWESSSQAPPETP